MTIDRLAATLPPVAIDDASLQPGALGGATEDDSARLFCYRHPASETYIRCNRCDQPICTKCAVQTPVGFKCRQCGLVKSATLSSFKPQQLALGVAIPVGGGALLGYLGGQMGIFGIFIAFFAGGIIAEAFVRTMGMKRGPIMRGLLYGGLLVGFFLGAALGAVWFVGSFGGGEAFPVELFLQAMLPYLLISIGAAFAGAYSRVRWF